MVIYRTLSSIVKDLFLYIFFSMNNWFFFTFFEWIDYLLIMHFSYYTTSNYIFLSYNQIRNIETSSWKTKLLITWSMCVFWYEHWMMVLQDEYNHTWSLSKGLILLIEWGIPYLWWCSLVENLVYQHCKASTIHESHALQLNCPSLSALY